MPTSEILLMVNVKEKRSVKKNKITHTLKLILDEVLLTIVKCFTGISLSY